MVRLAVLGQPAQPLPPEPPCNNDGRLRHITCSGGRQRLGRRSFCATLFGGGYRLRRPGERRLRGAQQSLEVCHGLSLSRHVSFLQKRGLADLCRSRPFLATLLSASPQSQLLARRPKVPPATTYTFRLFSLNNIHFYFSYILLPPDDYPLILRLHCHTLRGSGAPYIHWLLYSNSCVRL